MSTNQEQELATTANAEQTKEVDYAGEIERLKSDDSVSQMTEKVTALEKERDALKGFRDEVYQTKRVDFVDRFGYGSAAS